MSLNISNVFICLLHNLPVMFVGGLRMLRRLTALTLPKKGWLVTTDGKVGKSVFGGLRDLVRVLPNNDPRYTRDVSSRNCQLLSIHT